ncbi:Protein of unknown function [Pyronema omphalodes CBS 100304]|uniref:Uncharacterized protein n=1 Tax=Pyronema omphalodes (strain CBS 100304) TaxID=1076935 RepID=U4KUQ4_PYROM|nr:Protein of unknown function [Pyronema omphalodes CBS 100304]
MVYNDTKTSEVDLKKQHLKAKVQCPTPVNVPSSTTKRDYGPDRGLPFDSAFWKFMFTFLLSMFTVVWVANRLLDPPADWSLRSPREPPRFTSFAVYPYHLLPGEIDRFVCGNTLTCVWTKAADEHPVKMSSYYTSTNNETFESEVECNYYVNGVWNGRFWSGSVSHYKHLATGGW